MLGASSLSAGASIPPPSGGLKEGGIIRDHVAGVGRVSALVPGCAVVTGGGSGLGRGIATALASAGAPVAVVDLLPEGGKETVAAITGAGGRATFIQADVSRWSDVDGAIGGAVRELGPLGILVNAAGPGAVQTGLRANTVRILGGDAPVMRGVGGDEAAIKAITPAERRGTVEEIAACAVFLAGEAASYVTGHTLVVDGGWTAR